MFPLQRSLFPLLSVLSSSLCALLFTHQDLLLGCAAAATLNDLPPSLKEKIFGFSLGSGAQELIAKPRLRQHQNLWRKDELLSWSDRLTELGKTLETLVRRARLDAAPHTPPDQEKSREEKQLDALVEIADTPRAVLRWWLLGTPAVRKAPNLRLRNKPVVRVRLFASEQLVLSAPPSSTPPVGKTKFHLRNKPVVRVWETTSEHPSAPPSSACSAPPSRPSSARSTNEKPKNGLSICSSFPGRNGGFGRPYRDLLLNHNAIPFLPQQKGRAAAARAKIALALGLHAAGQLMSGFLGSVFDTAKMELVPEPVDVDDLLVDLLESMPKSGNDAKVLRRCRNCPPKFLNLKNEEWFTNVFLPLANDKEWGSEFLANMRVGASCTQELFAWHEWRGNIGPGLL